MKRLIEEVDNEGLDSLIGKYVVVWCLNYIYSGKLLGVNEHDIKLGEAVVVYETGKLTASNFQEAQPLPSDWYIRTATIESYGERANA